MYKSILLLFGMLFMLSINSTAQLSAGDIAIIGFNEDAGPQAGVNHSFSFIALTTISAGEVIYFTDAGVNINSSTWMTTSEAHYSWTAPSGGLTCGQIVRISETPTAEVLAATSGTVSSILSGTSWNTISGDQILMYQAVAAAPSNINNATFIAGITLNDGQGASEPQDPVTKWTATSANSGLTACHLPPGLTNGINCIALFTPATPEQDNVKFTGSLLGTSTVVRAAIYGNPLVGWSTTNSSPVDISSIGYSPSVTCITVCSTPPTAVCQNITVFLDGTGNATIAPSDLDGGSTVVCGPGTFSASKTSFNCGDIGANTVSFTVTDANSTTSSCNATVTVSDTISPTASCQNITVFLDGAGTANITAADINNGSTDNCTTVSLAANQTTFTCADLGPNAVILTVTDGSGNTVSCTSTVTVSDTVSPTAVCQNISVFLDGAGTASITASDLNGGSSDNCTTTTFAANQTAFTCADIGPNTVILTVTDGSGNTASCTSTVTVSDTVSPTAVCQDITVFLNGAGNASFVAADLDGGSTDNCGTASLSVSQTAFTCADLGANNVTLFVDDGNGNSSNCSAVVTVFDTISPTVACQSFTVNLDGAGNGSLVASDIDGGSSDNCGTVTLSASQTSFTCADAGMVNVTLTADDGNGNTSTCVAVVTVIGSSATGTDVQSACGTFFWIDGLTYTSSTNTPTFTIVGGAASGCDSIVTLDLTITLADQVMNVGSTSITSNSVQITWNALTLPVTGSFAIEYREIGTLPWLSGTFTTSVSISATINGLAAGTNYEARVTASCSTGQPGTTSASHPFSTNGGTCIDPMILSLASNSGNSVTLTWVPVPTVGWYQFRYKESTSSTWVSGGTIGSTATSKMIFGLNASTSYDFEGRRFCPAVGAWSTTLTITTDPLTGCNTPPVLTATTITGSSAAITWTAITGAGWYTFRYKEASSSTWIGGGSASGSATSKTYTGLNAGTLYDFEGRTFCTNGTSSAWGATTFTTSALSGCEIPPVLDLTPTAVTTTSIQIGWPAVSGAAWYVFQYKVSTSSTWLSGGSASGSATSKTYVGLLPGTSYDFQAKTFCPTGAGSAWSVTGTYMTDPGAPMLLTNDDVSDKDADLADKALSSQEHVTNVYPNPTLDIVNIEIYLDEASENTEIKLYDMSGRLVKAISTQTEVGSNTITMNVEELTNGLYTMMVYHYGNLLHTSKLKKK